MIARMACSAFFASSLSAKASRPSAESRMRAAASSAVERMAASSRNVFTSTVISSETDRLLALCLTPERPFTPRRAESFPRPGMLPPPVLELLFPENSVDLRFQRRRVERLDDVVVHPSLLRRDHVLGLRLGGHHDEGRAREPVVGAHLAQQLVAGHRLHVPVGDDQSIV